MRHKLKSRGAKIVALVLPLVLMPASAMAATSSDTSGSTDMFDPLRAPVITLKITAAKRAQVAQQKGSETVVSAQAIENKPGITNFTQVIASTIPGTASAAAGEVHIRGSHGQYSYYLDGAPLPANVTGSFSDLINPKNIQTLRVYTGGFPAEYGGQLAAIFDVTTKSGKVGQPGGFLQQLGQGYETFQTTGQVGGSVKDLSYFISGVRMSTGSDISPVTQDPLHDSGNESVGFFKFDYQSGAKDLITLDSGVNGAHLDIPDTLQQAAVGQDDDQIESGDFNNLIWHHNEPGNALSRLVYYSHTSHLKYNGSPGDLLSTPGGNPLSVDSIGLARTDEDQTASYNGVRFDQTNPFGKTHTAQFGFDADRVNVDQNFVITSIVDGSTVTASDPNPTPVPVEKTASDVGTIKGGDSSVYVQDDWKPGRTHINYGIRYDQHNADATTSQYSPRFNVDYTAGSRDSFRAYYDKLFQPASIEDVKQLTNNAITTGIGSQQVAIFQPERDDFFQFGWTHQLGSSSLGLDTYYRAEKNTIDDDVIGGSQIDVPVNFSKGYARGLEMTLTGQISKTLSYYGNLARSWAQEAGPITGGLDYGTTTPGYIYDDHDQTNSAAFGLEYDHRDSFFTLDGDYGSGFPYFLNSDFTDLQRTHPHLTLDTGIGTKIHSMQIAFTIDNILNHAYIIKQADQFTNEQWALGRQYGLKLTKSF